MFKAFLSPPGSPALRLSWPEIGQVLLAALVAAIGTFLAELQVSGDAIDWGEWRWAWNAAYAGLVWLVLRLLPDTRPPPVQRKK